MFTPISGVSWQTSCLHQEFFFSLKPSRKLSHPPKTNYLLQLYTPAHNPRAGQIWGFSFSYSALFRGEEEEDEGASEDERVRWVWRRRRKWSDSIREERSRSGVTEALSVGHRRQICKRVVNGFSILELNYAICLLGLVLPLFEGFKLQNALWALMSFFFSNTTRCTKRGLVRLSHPKWKIRADSLKTRSHLLWPAEEELRPIWVQDAQRKTRKTRQLTVN